MKKRRQFNYSESVLNSKITTQQAIQMIKDGWVFKSYKDKVYGHQVYLHDQVRATTHGFGYARYITHDVARNLIAKGYNPVVIPSPLQLPIRRRNGVILQQKEK